MLFRSVWSFLSLPFFSNFLYFLLVLNFIIPNFTNFNLYEPQYLFFVSLTLLLLFCILKHSFLFFLLLNLGWADFKLGLNYLLNAVFKSLSVCCKLLDSDNSKKVLSSFSMSKMILHEVLLTLICESNPYFINNFLKYFMKLNV